MLKSNIFLKGYGNRDIITNAVTVIGGGSESSRKRISVISQIQIQIKYQIISEFEILIFIAAGHGQCVNPTLDDDDERGKWLGHC